MTTLYRDDEIFNPTLRRPGAVPPIDLPSDRETRTTEVLLILVVLAILATTFGLGWSLGSWYAREGVVTVAPPPAPTSTPATLPRAVSPDETTHYRKRAAVTIAEQERVPAGLLLAVVQQESRWVHETRGAKGEYGLGQLMPKTALRVKVDRRDWRENLTGAARYLRLMFDEGDGTWATATRRYNGRGPAAKKYQREVFARWEGITLGAQVVSSTVQSPQTQD